jgi:precorrin-2 C(20)-methyltransferase
MASFTAIGVGPGDPDLLTVKAVKGIERAHVIYHAGPAPERGRALDVVRSLLRPEQVVRNVLTAPMNVVSADDWRSHYCPAVEQIAADCRRGLNVAFITEGDPTLYSTAAHMWQLLAERHADLEIEVIPGVSSITAAAARAGWPLAQKDETLLIVPAAYHAHRLPEFLAEHSSLCLLKVNSAFTQLVQTLRSTDSTCEAVYIENVGGQREWITRDLASAAGRDDYFSLVLVRKSSERPGELQPPRRTGKVFVVGIGPGDPWGLTRQALNVLHTVDDLVGYELYLNQLGGLGLRATVHHSPIGAEVERANRALELAQQGRQVALISSGDAGVYGMASLLLECAERMPEIAVEFVPGVTAAIAAAAPLGAPLGHDFACLSLSDLLTPWPVIEKRLEMAGHGDLVVAIYNPISARRNWQLPSARDILLRHRDPRTPVGLVTGVSRSSRRVEHTTLGNLTTDGVTMETMVIIGSSQTRVVNGRMVTPRGYGQPRQPPPSRDRAGAAAGPLPPGRGSVGGSLGQRIMRESFAIIERELGPHSLPPWVFAVIRRMIHASADFEFAQTLRSSSDFEIAIRTALQERVPIITDTEMVLLGIRSSLKATGEVTLACHLNDGHPSESFGLTRSAAGIRRAAQTYPNPILAIGNAPTALEEALRLVEEEGWRPAAIVGMPVGFVGVEEAKRRLQEQTRVPYLTCIGRKGGSAVTAAAINALAELSWPS